MASTCCGVPGGAKPAMADKVAGILGGIAGIDPSQNLRGNATHFIPNALSTHR